MVTHKSIRDKLWYETDKRAFPAPERSRGFTPEFRVMLVTEGGTYKYATFIRLPPKTFLPPKLFDGMRSTSYKVIEYRGRQGVLFAQRMSDQVEFVTEGTLYECADKIMLYAQLNSPEQAASLTSSVVTTMRDYLWGKRYRHNQLAIVYEDSPGKIWTAELH